MTKLEAKEVILTLLTTVVTAESLFVVYENTDNGQDDQKPDDNIPWVRISIRHRATPSTSLSDSVGKQRHEASGLVFVEIMVPVNGGTQVADDLSYKFETALRVRQSLNQSVWYTNIHSREVGQDDGWYKVNTVAEFHYDLIQ